MESDSRRLSFDLTSRILAILSLGVALASFGYLYTQDRVSGTRDELLASFERQLAQQSQLTAEAREKMEQEYQTALDRQDARLENWNSQLNEAIGAFRQDADALLTRVDEAEQTASEQRQLAFREALDNYSEGLVAGGQASPLNPPRNTDIAETRPEIKEGSGALDELSDVASLKVVTTLLRPGTGNTTLIVIENDGEQDALIDRIRFRPESEFETTDTFDLSSDVASSTVTTIAYATSDNTSTKPGYHGIYDRQLQEKIRVPAGERLTLRVMIDDPQYEGWGFSGKLVVDYNAAESLTVESAQVPFHGKT